jgi:mono/diheme cytochrome c family protein
MKRTSGALVGAILFSACGTHQPEPNVGPPGFPFTQSPSTVSPAPLNNFGPAITAAKPPAALSGGTLRILGDGVTAVAADPDRDQVYVVDLPSRKLRSTIALEPGDEPGRSIEDGNGRVHVVLRRGGGIATVDVSAGVIRDRRAVCAAPRGIAYDAATDLVHVACAGGELVSLPAAGGGATRTLQLEPDLRDVVVVGTGLWVSTFRTAHIIPVTASGSVGTDVLLPANDPSATSPTGAPPIAPAVAWRMAVLPNGQVGIAHEESQISPVETSSGGYGQPGAGCGSIVQSSVSFIDPATMQVTSSGSFAGVTLGVDFVIAPQAGTLTLLSAGSSHMPGFPNTSVVPLNQIVSDPGAPAAQTPPSTCLATAAERPADAEAIALAIDPQEQVWIQTREPARLELHNSDTFIALSNDSRADTGWAIFHSDSGAGLACASCHPEGGEDGRTWQFDMLGARRTQSLRGKVSGTAPFHWDGTLADFPSLVLEVYNSRMSGPELTSDQEQSLLSWIDSIPVLPHSPPADASAVTRGATLFTSQGCTACHNGPELTNNQTVDVGTGGNFQVARLLGVGWRPPFLHDGRAATLTDRFGSGGGGDSHGMTSTLSASQISDLVAYLNSI